jgi:DNA-directed RNA polymerase subunit L
MKTRHFACICRTSGLWRSQRWCRISFEESSKTLRVENETDTIANLVRCALLEHPGVEDAAFSRSHSTDDHFRLYVNARRQASSGIDNKLRSSDDNGRGDGGSGGGGGDGDNTLANAGFEPSQTKIETLTLVIDAIQATLAKLQRVDAQYVTLDAASPTPFYSYKDV